MKYPHVRIVAKVECSRCEDGRRRVEHPPGQRPDHHTEPCGSCHGSGFTETELLHAGEPFFLVRGHDQLGPTTIRVYEALGESAGADVTGLDELVARMREYQEDNPGLVKLAD